MHFSCLLAGSNLVSLWMLFVSSRAVNNSIEAIRSVPYPPGFSPSSCAKRLKPGGLQWSAQDNAIRAALASAAASNTIEFSLVAREEPPHQPSSANATISTTASTNWVSCEVLGSHHVSRSADYFLSSSELFHPPTTAGSGGFYFSFRCSHNVFLATVWGHGERESRSRLLSEEYFAGRQDVLRFDINEPTWIQCGLSLEQTVMQECDIALFRISMG